MFHGNNHHVYLFQTTKEIFEHNPELQEWKVVINEQKRHRGEHARRFNAPLGDEIGILMPSEPASKRDIVFKQKDRCLQQICEIRRSYDALQYRLLFPHGTDGYNIYTRRRDGKEVTQMQYYSFRIIIRS